MGWPVGGVQGGRPVGGGGGWEWSGEGRGTKWQELALDEGVGSGGDNGACGGGWPMFHGEG